MPNHAQRAALARAVMLHSVAIAGLSGRAEAMRLGRVSEQLFDIELQLARLHRDLLELPPKDPSVPPPDEPTCWVHDDAVPF